MELRDELKVFMQNVIWLRMHYGISKRKMMTILRVGAKTWRRIEQGDFPENVKIDVLVNVCRYFEIRPTKMLTVLLSEQNYE